MKITNDIKKQMTEIVKEKKIKTVFQPIVSLKNGSVFAYEALSRITFEKLEKKSLSYNDIIFEAPESYTINNMELYKNALKNYRGQGYGIGVDNMCSGYSGINRILDINPQYIKIDINIIKDIDNDSMKHSYVSALSRFARDLGIPLIALGVENSDQLKTLIELKIDYAQGFYLAKPDDEFTLPIPERKKEIINISNKLNKPKFSPSHLSTVKELFSKSPALSPDTMLTELHEIMNDPNVTETAIVDDESIFLGVLTKRQLLSTLSGMYGYTLHMHKTVSDVMDISCLTVTSDTPVETAAKMAMTRCQPYIYDSIPVIEQSTKKYLGFVSIKDLLLTTVNIQVKRAKDCNPLTGLPGNIIIDEKIEKLIGTSEPFAIIYFDIDNFKAFNDAYGFTNGDMMIKLVADTLTEHCLDSDFCGHVGGDDFVAIINGDRAENFCRDTFKQFEEKSREMYNETDRNRGFIVSKNRKGAIDEFPLASLSAAAITNRYHNFNSIKDLSLVIAQTKKQAKQNSGNSLVIV